MLHGNAIQWINTKKVDARLAHKKIQIEKLTDILTSEANLQSSQTSMADYSHRNSQQLKVVDYFRRNVQPQNLLGL